MIVAALVAASTRRARRLRLRRRERRPRRRDARARHVRDAHRARRARAALAIASQRCDARRGVARAAKDAEDAGVRRGASASANDPLMVRAARKEKVERAPAWMMRQAGRYMKEYRDLAVKHPSFRERSETTDLICEITLATVSRV